MGRPDNTAVDLGASWSYTASVTAGGDTQARAAVVGKRHYVTDVVIFNSSAAAVLVFIKDGSSGKVQLMVPANGSVNMRLQTPIRGSVNTALNVTPASATTTLYFNLLGYTA